MDAVSFLALDTLLYENVESADKSGVDENVGCNSCDVSDVPCTCWVSPLNGPSYGSEACIGH